MKNQLEERVSQIIRTTFQTTRRVESWEVILADLIEAASVYWEFTGDVNDFCIQSIGESSVVFGSVNRLVWTPFHGFKPDPKYCTPRFLDHYASLGAYPKS